MKYDRVYVKIEPAKLVPAVKQLLIRMGMDRRGFADQLIMPYFQTAKFFKMQTYSLHRKILNRLQTLAEHNPPTENPFDDTAISKLIADTGSYFKKVKNYCALYSLTPSKVAVVGQIRGTDLYNMFKYALFSKIDGLAAFAFQMRHDNVKVRVMVEISSEGHEPETVIVERHWYKVPVTDYFPVPPSRKGKPRGPQAQKKENQ